MIALILAVSVGMVVTVTTEKLNGYGSAACPTITQSSKEWIKELKNIQTGEDIPKNGDINLLDGTDGDPENLFKALLIVSSFTGLLIIEDVNVNNGYAYNDNNGGLNSTPANFTLDVNYNKSEGKMTLTKA